MKYLVKYRWTFNTLDEDTGVLSGELEKEFDLPLNLEDAVTEIHRQLAEANPASLRRSYTLLGVSEVANTAAQPDPPQVQERFTNRFGGDYPRMNMDDNSWAKMDEEDSM